MIRKCRNQSCHMQRKSKKRIFTTITASIILFVYKRYPVTENIKNIRKGRTDRIRIEMDTKLVRARQKDSSRQKSNKSENGHNLT